MVNGIMQLVDLSCVVQWIDKVGFSGVVFYFFLVRNFKFKVLSFCLIQVENFVVILFLFSFIVLKQMSGWLIKGCSLGVNFSLCSVLGFGGCNLVIVVFGMLLMFVMDFRKLKKLFWFLCVSFIRWCEVSLDFGKQIKGCVQLSGILCVFIKSQFFVIVIWGSIRDKISFKKLVIIYFCVIDFVCKILLSVMMLENF